MNDVVRVHPDTRLVICGTGPLLDELQGGRAIGRRGTPRDVRRPRRQRHDRHATARPPICSCCRRCSKRCRPSRSRRWRAGRRCSRPTIPAALELNDLFGAGCRDRAARATDRARAGDHPTSSSTSGGRPPRPARPIEREFRASAVRGPLPRAVRARDRRRRGDDAARSGRACLPALLGALAAVVWLALFYGLQPALVRGLRQRLRRGSC